MTIASFVAMTIFLAVLAFVCIYRAYIGPTAADRVVSINVITTKVTVLIALIAVITDQYMFIDVALIYAMMGFIATLAVSKYIEKGKLY
ncbi:multisubunit sodium/proton antiporter, MrpF subunit [Pelagirhabdus alkalitolerans]|uniref:Multisubunit sodium/proton antiporter, MrpF subunit n=1 Tax=Pelagirhabdus alkalitolerans TaxID=1612202 RepID=A0A1G6H8V6_9BACI|nr:monovalent cation/H+ antiporter complex subunit F [Pelagirhabdus alkalitolerans]SDB90385.1 multisubunit sodium/proton antiporter, MrpF subunit [Pelagirhabdus alkalitolerans]